MRAVADTNIVVSGLLWYGLPRQVFDHVRAGNLELFTSATLLAELHNVLGRKKISGRLELVGVSPPEVIFAYASLARVVVPDSVPRVVAADPDDDFVLACASAARAEVIITGDTHLLDLREYCGIRILTAEKLIRELV